MGNLFEKIIRGRSKTRIISILLFAIGIATITACQSSEKGDWSFLLIILSY